MKHSFVLVFAVLLMAAAPAAYASNSTVPGQFLAPTIKGIPHSDQTPAEAQAAKFQKAIDDLTQKVQVLFDQIHGQHGEIEKLNAQIQQMKTEATNASANTSANADTAKIDGLANQLSALQSAFKSHTHSYDKTTFGWAAGQVNNIHMAVPTPTSAPQ